jgi:hypothetical protein
VGTSFAEGARIPFEKSFGWLLPAELSQRTGRKVELYNESIPDRFPATIAANFDEVMKAEPDLILYAVTPRDIQYETEPPRKAVDTSGRKRNALGRAWRVLKAAFTEHSIAGGILDTFNNTRTSILLRNILYQSQSQYLKTSLIGSDDAIGYLNSEPSAAWQKRIQSFSADDTALEAKAKAAGVPLAVVLLPDRAISTMIQVGEWPAGIDPYKLDDELRAIVAGDGGIYLDMPRALRTLPNPRRGFFPQDGHPNPEGHAMIAEILANELTRGAVPALSKTALTYPVREKNQ